jgi:hypothetical protein
LKLAVVVLPAKQGKIVAISTPSKIDEKYNPSLLDSSAEGTEDRTRDKALASKIQEQRFTITFQYFLHFYLMATFGFIFWSHLNDEPSLRLCVSTRTSALSSSRDSMMASAPARDVIRYKTVTFEK